MKDQTLWRVRQKRIDHGPFGHESFTRWWAAPRNRNVHNYPTPLDEGLPLGYDHSCACVSIPQLRHWFGTKAVVKRLEPAHELVRLRVPSELVHVGKWQAAYTRSQSVLDGVWPLSNLLRPMKEWANV